MMSKVGFLIVLFSCFLCVSVANAQTEFSCEGVTEIPILECEALVAFYNSTNGDRWFYTVYFSEPPSIYYYYYDDEDYITYSVYSDFVREGWLQTSTPCSWQGVVCFDGHVIILRKRDSNLSGTVPAEISNLTHLTRLWLSKNELTTLPPEIGDLSNLESLDLSANQWTMLPPEIWNLINLTELKLYGTELTTLLPEIGNLTHLTRLWLWGNELTTLPPEIGNLSNLTELWLSSNQLTTFPPEISNLSNLTELSLRDNEITILPPEIGNLNNLTQLDLDHNQLTALPPEIGNLSNLTWLDLDDNQLSILPSSFLDLTTLSRGLSKWMEDVCVESTTSEVEAWRDETGITTLQACPQMSETPTAVAIAVESTQATNRSIRIVWLVLLFTAVCSTYAMTHSLQTPGKSL